MRRHVVAVSLALGVVALCLVVRSLVQTGMALGHEVPLIPGFFSLRYVRNPGAAFSLFAGVSEGFRVPFLVTVAVLALVVIAAIYVREGHTRLCLWLGLPTLAGGAAANLVERLLVGAVTDYLDVYLGSYHWPTFNLADVAINVGVGLLLLDAWTGRRSAS